MLPKVVLRVRKAVRRLAFDPLELEQSTGTENVAGWKNMMSRVRQRDREIERRLAQAERALNRLDHA